MSERDAQRRIDHARRGGKAAKAARQRLPHIAKGRQDEPYKVAYMGTVIAEKPDLAAAVAYVQHRVSTDAEWFIAHAVPRPKTLQEQTAVLDQVRLRFSVYPKESPIQMLTKKEAKKHARSAS